MTPLYFYFTRPDAYELYMGGKRDVKIWVQPPSYSHQSVEHNFCNKTFYVDQGWTSPHTGGAFARYILEQDKTLIAAIWKEILLSVAPKGMNYEEALEWEKSPIINAYGEPDTAYHYLFEDKKWEDKCNTCYKRFLLKVDVRTNTVERVVPFVLERGRDEEGRLRKYQRTDQCKAPFSSEYYQENPDMDDILPF